MATTTNNGYCVMLHLLLIIRHVTRSIQRWSPPQITTTPFIFPIVAKNIAYLKNDRSNTNTTNINAMSILTMADTTNNYKQFLLFYAPPIAINEVLCFVVTTKCNGSLHRKQLDDTSHDFA